MKAPLFLHMGHSPKGGYIVEYIGGSYRGYWGGVLGLGGFYPEVQLSRGIPKKKVLHSLACSTRTAAADAKD